MRRAGIGCLALWVVVVVWGIGVAAHMGVSHIYRWMVTTAPAPDEFAPPWGLVWEQSPLWFERWDPGGASESPSRRLAEGPDALVTVMRRMVYGLDRQTGRVLWTLPLRGREIFDWRVAGGTFFYAAYDLDESTRQYSGIRAAISLRDRRSLWVDLRPTRHLEKEWILVQRHTVVFSSPQEWKLAALSIQDGTPLWTASQPDRPIYPVMASWFAFGDVLYALAAHRDMGGLILKRYDLATGQPLPPLHLFGPGAVSNMGVPPAVTEAGHLFAEYREPRTMRAWLIAYDLATHRLLWERQVLDGTELPEMLRYARQIALPARAGDPLLVTYWPDRVRLVDPGNGAILKDHVLTGYTGWTEHNALLYSFPFLYTSARRAADSGMAYDLVCLNLETGRIEWRREIERQDKTSLTASAEILNYLVVNKAVYLSRADGRVMAFRPSPSRSGHPR